MTCIKFADQSQIFDLQDSQKTSLIKLKTNFLIEYVNEECSLHGKKIA